MKVIFGIDAQETYKPAVQLFARFRFEAPDALLAHFVNPTLPFVPIEVPDGAQMQVEYMKTIENMGLEALDHAKDEACMRNIKAKCQLKFGSPTDGLNRLAEETHADLVAVRANLGSLWATSFLGSVSRGVTIGCKSSILIAKEPVKEAAPLKVVLATDHSEESQRWLRKFLSWKPQGISEIHVVTAYEIDDHEAAILQKNLPSLGGMVDAWIEEHLQGLSQRVVDQLTAAGYKATYRVAAGTANDVIREAMQDTQSDVLVLGAQGHGFIERLLIGSTSLHQVVSEPYPVLVVRS